MCKKGDRVTILNDIEVSGVNPGDKATVHSVSRKEKFYPVQIRLDRPSAEGHYYHRVDYSDIQVIKEDPFDWMNVPEDQEIPL